MKPVVHSLLFPAVPLLLFRLCGFREQSFHLLSLDSPARAALADNGDLFADLLGGGLQPLPFPRKDVRIRHAKPGVCYRLAQQPLQGIRPGLDGHLAVLLRSSFQSAQFRRPCLQIQSRQFFKKPPDMQHSQKALFHGFRPAV